MVPAALGMAATRVNYDMLDYLPEDMDTVQQHGEKPGTLSGTEHHQKSHKPGQNRQTP